MMWCDGRSDVLETSNHLKIESIVCRNDSQFRFQSIAVFFCRKGTSSTCSNRFLKKKKVFHFTES